jgi:EmrB/QacA subfamily drug resistance transporter
MTITSTEPTRAPVRSPWLAMGILCTGMLMILLDTTIVNVALRDIQTDLGFSQSGLAWVANAYLIAFGGLLLLAGRLGDLHGQRRVFLGGLALFTVASLLCGVAQTGGMLVTMRFVQGVGGALTSAGILAMISTLFDSPAERARAYGVYTFIAAGGAALGMLAGGLITQWLNWHWVFIVNVPIGTAVALLALRHVPADGETATGRHTDVLSAVLVTAGVMLAVYGIVQIEKDGLVSLAVLGPVVAGVAVLATFIARQATAGDPLMPLQIFRSRTITGANVVLFVMYTGAVGFLFLGPLYFMRVLGYSAIATGLAMAPMPVAIGLVSVRPSPWLQARFGQRPVMLGGLALLVAGQGLLIRLPETSHYVTSVLPTLLLSGVGFGLALTTLTAMNMGAANAHDAGLASGLFNTTRQLGMAIGVTMSATLAESASSQRLDDGQGIETALVSGYHLAFGVGAALMVAAWALTATLFRRTPRQPVDAPEETGQLAVADAA